MTQYTVLIDSHCGRIVPKVDQYASRASLDVCQYDVGQCHRGDKEACNLYFCLLEASHDVALHRSAGHDVQEVPFQLTAEYTHRVGMNAVLHFILLRHDIQNIQVLVTSLPIDVHKMLHVFFRDDPLCVQLVHHEILYRT